MANLTKEKVTALLGRPLSTVEDSNFNLYLNIAKLRLEDITCSSFDDMSELPDDLALVWARFFGGVVEENQSGGNIASKKVEDFQITYRESNSVMADLMNQNAATIAKYSQCAGAIRHGETIPVNRGGYNEDDRF